MNPTRIFWILLVLPLACAVEVSPDRVLYVTHSAGFRHDVLPHSQEVLQRLGALHGIEVTATEDLSLLSEDSLSRFRGLVFFTSGELPLDSDQKEAFLQFLLDGGGFAGIHSATDTFYEWSEYGEIIGGYFDGHPWHEEVTIRVEDPDHPATRHLGESFRINDEIYQFRNFSRARVHVLMSLDTDSVDMTKDGIRQTDFPLAWTNTYGQGRIFYTALGHRREVWDDERFQTHLMEGIAWTIGRR